MLYYAVPCCAVLIYAELLYTAILSPALLCQLARNQADFRDIRSVQYVLCTVACTHSCIMLCQLLNRHLRLVAAQEHNLACKTFDQVPEADALCPHMLIGPSWPFKRFKISCMVECVSEGVVKE